MAELDLGGAVGEPFDLMLTCAVVETEANKVVPDQSKLDPDGGAAAAVRSASAARKAPDMLVPGKRFFQYDYRLRLITEGAFGADVTSRR